MRQNIRRCLCLGAAIVMVTVAAGYASEEMHYRKFKLDDVTCDAGILYTGDGEDLVIGVSAIATGNGAEFRKWEVTDIRARIDGVAVHPKSESKFFVTKESLFRIPAAVVFAAIGTQLDFGGSSLQQGIGKAGAAIGLGLLVLQAHGEITGEKCVFRLDPATAERLGSNNDAIEITVENEGLHRKEVIKIGMAKPSGTVQAADYEAMDVQQLQQLINERKEEVDALEREQTGYHYGADPQYDILQNKIETLQTERGVAYNVWFKKTHPDET